MKMEFSAGGLVYRKTGEEYQFALIKSLDGQWTYPKGHIEKQEKTEDAAIRETTEEIGLAHIRIIKLIEKSDYWFKFNDELIHKFVYFYLMQDDSLDPLTPQIEEIQDAQWFSPKEAIDAIGYKKQNLPILLKSCALLGLSCPSATEDIK